MKLLSYLSLSFFSGVLTGFWVFCPESSNAKKKYGILLLVLMI